MNPAAHSLLGTSTLCASELASRTTVLRGPLGPPADTSQRSEEQQRGEEERSASVPSRHTASATPAPAC